jgi:CheY-like chemotaxis protein
MASHSNITSRNPSPLRVAGTTKRRLRATASSAATQNDSGTLKDVSILIVEDDPTNAKMLRVALAHEGCDVRVAASAEEALRVLAVFKPRLILLDLILPQMSGLLLAQELKAAPSTRDIVLIAVSAFNGPETRRVAKEAGCHAYLRKPLDIDELPDLLIAYLAGLATGRTS